MILDESVYLEHFGVKGMHWGVRNPKNKELNKAFTKKAREKNRVEIEGARERIKSGENKAKLKKAKAQYHRDKERLGSREARAILNKKRQKLNDDFYKSQEYKNGKEVAGGILIAVGTVIVAQALSRAISGKY